MHRALNKSYIHHKNPMLVIGEMYEIREVAISWVKLLMEKFVSNNNDGKNVNLRIKFS